MESKNIPLLKRIKAYVNEMFTTKNSSVKFAFVGKGGVGKTTLCALLSQALDNEGYKVLSIDINPDVHLAQALGVRELHSIAQEHYFLNAILDGHDCVLRYTFTPKDFTQTLIERFGVSWGAQSKVLSLGSEKHGGAECFLSEKSALWSMIRSISKEEYDVILIDTEAGLETLRQGFSSNIDILVTLFQSNQRSIAMAKDAKRLAQNNEIANVIPVLSGYRNEVEITQVEDLLGSEVAFTFPYLDVIQQAAIEGSFLTLDSMSQNAMRTFALDLYTSAAKTVA